MIFFGGSYGSFKNSFVDGMIVISVRPLTSFRGIEKKKVLLVKVRKNLGQDFYEAENALWTRMELESRRDLGGEIVQDGKKIFL